MLIGFSNICLKNAAGNFKLSRLYFKLQNILKRYFCLNDCLMSLFSPSHNWAAKQALGKPNVYPDYGDLKKAWASRKDKGKEWIEVLNYSSLHFFKEKESKQTQHRAATETDAFI